MSNITEGSLVKIDARVGGGYGEVIEMSPSRTHAIVLITTKEGEPGDRGENYSYHLSDLELREEDDNYYANMGEE